MARQHGIAGPRRSAAHPPTGRLLRAWTAAAVLLVVAQVSCSREPPRPARGAGAPARPNVLLVTIDSLRADHLGCAGYPRATSPHLDELARRGVHFRRALAQGPGTFSALPALVTSRYPQDHTDAWLETGDGPGMAVGRLAPDSLTVGRALRQAGYDTAFISGHPWLHAIVGLRRGLQVADVGDYRAAQVTDKAIEILRATGDRPLFLWLHYMDPHVPYDPPPPFDEKFVNDGKLVTGRILALSEHQALGAGGIPRRTAVGARRELDFYVARYDGEIAYTDQEIGRLLAAVRDLGLEARTLVVVTADHGESMGEHDLYFSHLYNLHASILDIPMILAGPGVPAARVIDAPVMAVDLLPTIAEWVAVRPSEGGWVGRSLVACARGGPCPSEAYATRGSGQAALRTARWKIICDHGEVVASAATSRPTPRCELFDLDRDPRELEDVAAAHPAQVAELRGRLEAWMRAHPDPRTRAISGLIPEPDEELLRGLRSLGYLR